MVNTIIIVVTAYMLGAFICTKGNKNEWPDNWQYEPRVRSTDQSVAYVMTNDTWTDS